MAQPAALASVPSHLRPLVERLASLSASEREAIVRAARGEAGRAGRLPVVPPELVEASVGVVSLGGDAIADCEALYDR